MNIGRNHLVAAAAALAVSALASAAVAADTAAVLDPGKTVSVPDFEDSGLPIGSKSSGFGDGSGATGVLTEFAISPDGKNPFGVGDVALAFSLQMSAGDVVKIALPGYAGFETAVRACDDTACFEGVGTAPTTASRSGDGDVVTFFFATPVTDHSSGFVIYTNARSFVDPMAEITDSLGNTIDVAVLGPAGAVPEPATWAMLLTGFFGSGAMLRRRSAAARA